MNLFLESNEKVSKRELIFLFGIAGILHFLITLITQSPTVFVTSISTATQILEGRILYYNVETPYPAGYPAWPPIWPYFLALIFYITGPSELVVRIICSILTIACGMLIFKIGSYFFLEREAYFATVLYFINLYIVLNSLGVHFEGLAVFFLLLAVLFAYKDNSILSGITIALGIMTKIFPGIFIAIIVPYWLGKHQWRNIIFFSTSCIGVCTLIALPFLIICPNDFFYWVLGFHTERDSGGLSILYYWFYDTFLWTTSISFLLIILFVLGVSFIIYQKSRKNEVNLETIFINWNMFIFIGVMVFIRVLYSRYIAFIIPFLCLQTIYICNVRSDINFRKYGNFQQLSFFVSAIGVCIHSIPWIIEGFRPKSFRPPLEGIEPFQLLYWIGASIFHIGFISAFIISFLILKMISEKKRINLKIPSSSEC